MKRSPSTIQNPGINQKDLLRFFLIWVILITIVVLIKVAREYVFYDNTSIYNFLKVDVPTFFPFSFSFPTINLEILYVIPIIAYFSYLVVNKKINSLNSMIYASILLIFMNYANGGFDKGFFINIIYGDVAYYNDSILIDDWRTWLAEFNLHQQTLGQHGRTHPPGATLLLSFLSSDGNHIPAILVYIGIAIFNLNLVRVSFRNFGFSIEKAGLATILLAVIPSYNIYGLISADSVFFHFFGFFLFGLSLFNKGYNFIAFIYISVSLITTHFFTFAGTFLLALGGLYSIYYFLSKNKLNFAILFCSSTLFFMVFYYIVYVEYGFNIIQSFEFASYVENPNGFRLFANPLDYIMTRLECVWEYLIFLGIPFTILLFKRKLILDDISKLSILVVVLMLLAGAFRTGETGRVLIFLTPFILLSIRKLEISEFKYLFLVILVQSLIMQTFSYWIW